MDLVESEEIVELAEMAELFLRRRRKQLQVLTILAPAAVELDGVTQESVAPVDPVLMESSLLNLH
jgi:hypothetical protein